MSTRNLAPWLRVVLAALVLALGSGVGLPGIVRAMAPAQQHVCTCANGGNHDSCPVCNGTENVRSRHARVSGVPCGERLITFGGAAEPAVVQAPGCVFAAPFERVDSAHDIMRAPDTVFAKPTTPPPRLAST